MEGLKRSEVFTRWGQLKIERQTFWYHWQEITNYLLPYNGRYFRQDRNRGWRRNNNIFDNTATKALSTLSAGMMSGMTSPARPWFKLGTPDPDLAKSMAVKTWLNDVTNVILRIFEKGNTYRALHSIYKELGGFGTSASIIIDDYQDVLRHYNLTTGEFCIAQDWRGEVCTLYREFEKTVSDLVKEFGKENVSTTVRNMYDSGQLDAWIPIIQAIEPRQDRDPSRKDALNKAWSSSYWEVGGDPDRPLRVSGFDNFPVLAPRWDIVGGDIYGNSPAMEALGDIKQLQQEQLRKSQGIDFMTKPPLQMPTSMKNREVDALPGGISYLDTTGTPGTRNLFQVQLDLNHLLADIQDVRDRINSSFYADLFLMLANSTQKNMTATEVAERHEEKLLMLGPVLERLNNELLEPLVELAFTRALKAGILPPPPPDLHGQELNVEFVSVLAQAQRAVGTNSIDRWVGALGQVAAFKPEVLDNFDPDQYAEIYADMLGVDPNLLVASDKVALVRKQRAQAQQAAQQAQINNMRADTAQKLGNSPTQGGGSNALNDIMGNLSGYGASPEQVAAAAAPGQ